MKREQSGLTIIEILTVVGIIAILIGLLIPATQVARRFAKNTQQRAQLVSIGLGIEVFKGDYGDYPPSAWEWDPTLGPEPSDASNTTASLNVCFYTGAQKLAEAMVGRDFRGFAFAPLSDWRPDDGQYATVTGRRNRYVDGDTANAFRLAPSGGLPGLYSNLDYLSDNTFVLCDVFGRNPVMLEDHVVKAGSPILYYKANTSGLTSRQIYEGNDNMCMILNAEKPFVMNQSGDVVKTPGPLDPLRYAAESQVVDAFYNYIHDPKMGSDYPYRPDSYILISAGEDGLYGTPDDVRNFGDN